MVGLNKKAFLGISPKLSMKSSASEVRVWMVHLKTIALSSGWRLESLRLENPIKSKEPSKEELNDLKNNFYEFVVNHKIRAGLLAAIIASIEEPAVLKSIDLENMGEKVSPDAKEKIKVMFRELIVVIERKLSHEEIIDVDDDEDIHEKMLLIMNSIDSSLRIALMNKEYNPFSYIKEIQEIFNRSTWGRVVELNQQLFNLKMKENETISTYYDRASIIGDNLKELTGEAQSINIVSNFLNGLSSTYSAAKNNILTKNISMNDTNINDIIEILYQFESIANINNNSNNGFSNENVRPRDTVLWTSHNNPNARRSDKMVNCYNCGKKGHYSNKCRSKKKINTYNKPYNSPPYSSAKQEEVHIALE